MSLWKSQLGLESLEAREVPAVAFAYQLGNVAVFALDSGGGSYVATKSGNSITVTASDGGSATVNGQGGIALTLVQISGSTGNDTIDVDTGTASYVYGGGGNDTLHGGSGRDWLDGGNGNDRLFGYDNNDSLFGRSGADYIRGGNGSDFLDDGSGTDSEDISGEAGDDFWAARITFGGMSGADVDQRGTPTCWVLAPLAAAADQGINLAGRITYLGDGEYRVKLLGTGGNYSYETVKLSGGIASFEPTTPDSESWVILFHRAIMQAKGVDWSNQSAYSGGWPADVLTYLTGRSVQGYGNNVWGGDFNMQQMTEMKQKLDAGKLVCACTRQGDYGSWNAGGSVSSPLLVGAHCYEVVDINTDTQKVILRNPWGVDGGDTISGADDGLVTISFTTFYNSIWSCAVS